MMSKIEKSHGPIYELYKDDLDQVAAKILADQTIPLVSDNVSKLGALIKKMVDDGIIRHVLTPGFLNVPFSYAMDGNRKFNTRLFLNFKQVLILLQVGDIDVEG